MLREVLRCVASPAHRSRKNSTRCECVAIVTCRIGRNDASSAWPSCKFRISKRRERPIEDPQLVDLAVLEAAVAKSLAKR